MRPQIKALTPTPMQPSKYWRPGKTVIPMYSGLLVLFGLTLLMCCLLDNVVNKAKHWAFIQIEIITFQQHLQWAMISAKSQNPQVSTQHTSAGLHTMDVKTKSGVHPPHIPDDTPYTSYSVQLHILVLISPAVHVVHVWISIRQFSAWKISQH